MPQHLLLVEDDDAIGDALRLHRKAEPVLRFGPWQLDTTRRELRQGDTPRVADAARVRPAVIFGPPSGLGLWPGWTVVAVWGTDLDGYERTVNSQINRLRNKIEHDPRCPCTASRYGALATALIPPHRHQLHEPAPPVLPHTPDLDIGGLADDLRRADRRARPQSAGEHEQESLQRLSHGLAQQIVGHWPEINTADPTQAGGDEVQASAHREVMASVAHDLRTPLTAPHGDFGAWAGGAGPPAVPTGGAGPQQDRLLAAALLQSDTLRWLSPQLFELAALQSDHQVLHLERFNLDERVTDAVQKCERGPQPPLVTLAGAPPGRLALDGDLQRIERTLSNLNDKALRHASGGAPVRVSRQRNGASAQILIEDAGPGLPPELHHRLSQQRSLHDPPIKRTGGGIGGLSPAIAQRVALLHGGCLLPLPAPLGGQRLCLALLLAA